MRRAISTILGKFRKFQHIVEAGFAHVETVKGKTNLPFGGQRQRQDVDVVETVAFLNEVKRKVGMHDYTRPESAKEMCVTRKLVCNKHTVQTVYCLLVSSFIADTSHTMLSYPANYAMLIIPMLLCNQVRGGIRPNPMYRDPVRIQIRPDLRYDPVNTRI